MAQRSRGTVCFAVTQGRVLAIWEAQFGDFANNAQAYIDQFLAAGTRSTDHRASFVCRQLDAVGTRHYEFLLLLLPVIIEFILVAAPPEVLQPASAYCAITGVHAFIPKP